jgi:hypothetical protein
VLISRVGIALAVGASVLVALATPAFAHHPVLAGEVICSPNGQGNNAIKWTIGNSEATTGRSMSITAISATMNGRSYPVLGYVSPIAPAGHTYAYTLVPVTRKGHMRLDVSASWPTPATATGFTSVTMPGTCTQSTTTTTPTTTPETTTPPTTTPETTTPPTTTPETTTPPTTTPETTTPPTTTADTTVPNESTTTTTGVTQTSVGGNEGGTTTTSETPVTLAGTPIPPSSTNPPVGQLGSPVPAAPSGSLPFTGSGGGWALFGALLLCAGLVLAFMPKRRSHARG